MRSDASAVEFSIVVPTYNERSSIADVLRDITLSLGERPYEIIVVDDDSPDGTMEVVRGLVSRDARIRAIRRTASPRDLALSVLEGFHAARGSILGSINADGSHDPAVLMKLWGAIRDGADVAIGSRYEAGARLVGWPAHRRILSSAATWLTRLVTGVSARDPLSGFYALKRDVYTASLAALPPRGFKLLLEFLVRARPQRVAEVPVCFRDRRAGRSKLSWKVAGFALVSVVRLRRTRAAHTQRDERENPHAGTTG